MITIKSKKKLYVTIITNGVILYRQVYFYSKKNNTITGIYNLIRLAKTQYDRIIKRQRIDNNREYGPKKLSKLTKALGMIIKVPRKYTLPALTSLALLAALEQAKPFLALQYRRLGYISLKNVRKTQKITKGIQFKEQGELQETILYEPYELRKPIRYTRRTTLKRPLNLLDLVYVDIVIITIKSKKKLYITIITNEVTLYR